MDEWKINAGLGACLEHCKQTDRPFTSVSAFIESLKHDPIWSDAEVIELQTRVIRHLLHHRVHPPDGGG